MVELVLYDSEVVKELVKSIEEEEKEGAGEEEDQMSLMNYQTS